MAAINVTRVTVLNNPATFQDPFAFEIEYECLDSLKDDLEWKMTYVGSAESDQYDQVLDSVHVGPVYAGSYKFQFEGDAPNPAKLPSQDVLGVTVVLLTCSYRDQEFIRIGYYVNNEYTEQELKDNPPEALQFNKLSRSILADHPRVTRFPCDFDSPPVAAQPAAAEAMASIQMDADVSQLPGAMQEDHNEAPITFFQQPASAMAF